jgi:hypothetical protein
MDELLTTVIEQAPTMLGLAALAYVLWRQTERQQIANDKLLERIIMLTIEMRDCVKTVTQTIRQQEEID